MGIKREGRTPKGTWGVRNSCLCALIIILSACSGSSKQNFIESQDLVLTGSVGDGPIVGADIRVEDADGELIFEGLSDETANYRFDVPDGTRLPVTVRVSGGTDLVTSRGADFEMLSVAFSSGPTTLNVSPYTTLAVKTARCLGGISPENIETAWALVDGAVNLGWQRDDITDLMGEEIDDTNIATVLVASEALGELIRRTAAASAASIEPMSTDEILDQLACDIADGALDGNGDGVSSRAGLTLAANATVIGLEVIAGTLRVDDSDAMERLDHALQTVLPGSMATVNSLPPAPALIDQTRDRLGIFATPDEPALFSIAMAMEGATESTARAQVSQALSSANTQALDTLSEEIAQAQDAELEAIAARQQMPSEPPFLSFAADPVSVQSGDSTRLSWAASNVEACVADGGWSGARSGTGSELSRNLTTATEFVLTCGGRGGVVTERVFITVTTPAPQPEPEPDPDPEPQPDPDPQPEPEPEPTLAPVVGLQADRSSVDAGESVSLSWNATNANACSASGAWGGSRSVSGSQTVGPLSADVTFVLTCTGPGGNQSASQAITVRQPEPRPDVTLSVNNASIMRGESIRLTWSASNASSCAANGGWTGTLAASGSRTLSPTASTSYGLTCTGPGGSDSASVSVTVSAPSPTLSLNASSGSVDEGDSVTLSWSSANTLSCTASGGWSGSRNTSGSASVGPLTSTTTFALQCSGDGGGVNDSVTVTVTTAPEDPPVVSLNLASSQIDAGGSTSLSWSAANATNCVASGAWSGARATSGSITVSPAATSTYNLNCTGDGGSDGASTTLTVIASAPSLTFTSSEDLVSQGGGVTLSWNATDASSCTAGGGWSGARNTSGNQFVGNIDSSTTFSLTCTGPGGNVVEMLTVSTMSSVALNWVAPSENVDGSPLIDLAGYRIYYGTSSRNYSDMVELNDPTESSHTLNLASGDYYVAMTALDQEGNESGYSNEVLKTAP